MSTDSEIVSLNICEMTIKREEKLFHYSKLDRLKNGGGGGNVPVPVCR